MADLDDFFAKKDRKKSKGKKFTTTDEIAKKLEETGKRMEKLKLKEKPSNIEEEDPLAPEVIFFYVFFFFSILITTNFYILFFLFFFFFKFFEMKKNLGYDK